MQHWHGSNEETSIHFYSISWKCIPRCRNWRSTKQVEELKVFFPPNKSLFKPARYVKCFLFMKKRDVLCLSIYNIPFCRLHILESKAMSIHHKGTHVNSSAWGIQLATKHYHGMPSYHQIILWIQFKSFNLKWKW